MAVKQASAEEVLEKALWLIERVERLDGLRARNEGLRGTDFKSLGASIKRLNKAAVRLVVMAADMLEPSKVGGARRGAGRAKAGRRKRG